MLTYQSSKIFLTSDQSSKIPNKQPIKRNSIQATNQAKFLTSEQSSKILTSDQSRKILLVARLSQAKFSKMCVFWENPVYRYLFTPPFLKLILQCIFQTRLQTLLSKVLRAMIFSARKVPSDRRKFMSSCIVSLNTTGNTSRQYFYIRAKCLLENPLPCQVVKW